MQAYKYDQTTREYLGTCPLVPNPRRPDAPCLPAFASLKPVPEDVPPGHTPRFVSEEVGWEIVEDHRGEIWYRPDTREAVRVSELGPISEGLVAERPPEPLADLLAAKRAEIRDAADAFLAAHGQEYGQYERQTWEQQSKEAAELASDPQAVAPLVRAIAAARGMDVPNLAMRIRSNEAAWKVLAGHVVGQRLGYQDQLDAAAALVETDPEAARTAIVAIVPAYTVPA